MDRKYLELASAGVIDAVCQAVSTQSSAEVAATGCRIRKFLARNDANKEKIAALGGIEAVVRVMGTLPEEPEVQEEACGALGNLAANNNSNKEKIAALGGIEAVVRAMGTLPAEPKVQENACLALYNFPSRHKEKIKKAGGGGRR